MDSIIYLIKRILFAIKGSCIGMLSYIKKEIRDLKPGEVVLHPIFRSDGLLLINRYKILTSSVIAHIRGQLSLSIPVLVLDSGEQLEKFIKEEYYNTPEFIKDLEDVMNKHQEALSLTLPLRSFLPVDTINVESTSPDVEETQHHEQTTHSIFSSPLWESFDQLLESPQLQERAVQVKKELLRLLMHDEALLPLFNRIKNYHDALFVHSLNTTCISIAIGLTLELRNSDLIDLALATWFVDIGFTQLPKELFIDYLNNGKQNVDLLKKHIKLSLELVAESANCRKRNIIHGILDHHEYYNGKGIPSGKRGNEISLFGRIISISQAYDEMVGGYIKETGFIYADAQRFLWENKGERFDPNILQIFFHRTSTYKIGKRVQLEEKEAGVIIGFSNYVEEPLLPIVKLDSGEVKDYYFEYST
jgi:HD-GYP domain-containing protein (c-di-GMP phosphodiesterase class II)